MLLCAVVSAGLSDDPRTSFLGRYDSWAYGVWGLTLVAASAQLASRAARGREESPARLLAWSAAFVGGYGALQKAGFDPVFHIKTLPLGGRAVSTLGSPVDLGALLAVLWPAALWRADEERTPLALLLAALTAAGLAASGARGAMLGAAVGTAAFLLLSRRGPQALKLCAVGAAAFAAAAVAWSCRAGGSVSDLARKEVWKAAWTIFKARPWLGWGPDGFEDAFKLHRTDEFIALLGSVRYQAYAHNDLLHVLAGLGLVGLAAYGWLLWSAGQAGRRALETPAARPLAAALTAGLLGLWVDLQLNPVALEVLIAAGACAGLLASLAASPAPRSPRRPLLGALALVAAVSFFGSARLAAADAAFKSGLRAQASGDFAAARRLHGDARRLAPCELFYMTAELNASGDWINATHTVPERLALLDLADADGAAALACHPRQSGSHYAAALSSRMRADLGFSSRLADSVREYEAALALDPKFEPLQQAMKEARSLNGSRRP